MGLPIGTALFGLGIGIALVSLLSNVISMPDFTTCDGGDDRPRRRHRLRAVHRHPLPGGAASSGSSVEDAIVESIDTSGRAVLFAGITVIISLLGLFLIGLSFVQGLAIASSLGVLMMMLGSLTLLPALLGWVGTRIDNTTRAALIAVGLAVVGALVRRAHRAGRRSSSSACSLAIVLFAVSFFVKPLRKLDPAPRRAAEGAALLVPLEPLHPAPPVAEPASAPPALLILLAIPLFSIRLGFGDTGNHPEDTTVRRAYDLLAEGFGPGTNGPLFITVEGDDGHRRGRPRRRSSTTVAADRRTSPPPFPTPISDGLALVIVYPESAPQDAETTTLVNTLRDDVIPATGVDAKVGGFTAASTDFSDYLGERMPLLIGVVLLLSFLLLMAVFRSVLVPLKAVIMNLLSIGAAYGILVAIFQWGWGKDLIGVDKAGPIEAWVPMLLFAIVFGLSMDYEVFLLSRIKEEYDRTKDNATAVADGLAATARVITAAALIMFCVFGAFVLGDDRAAQAVRPRPGDRRADRRHDRPHGPRAGDDGAARRPQLVDPEVARPDPAEHQVEGKHHIAPVPTSELEGEGDGRQGARARLTPDPPVLASIGDPASERPVRRPP